MVYNQAFLLILIDTTPMVFVACGLNHQTAPLSLREKVALDSASKEALLQKLLAHPKIHEAAILSTCNRTEFYCATEDSDFFPSFLSNIYQLPLDYLAPVLYIHEEEAGVKHLLRVASGLDSMMLGEPQILGQMKEAYQAACQSGTVKTHLRSLFEYIFSASKRIRTQSGIGANPVSVAYTAVLLIGQLFSDYKALKIMLIGSGETTSLVAKYLHQAGVSKFLIASRTPENAQKLAQRFGGETLGITDIPQYLSQADVVISATTCPLPFINKTLVTEALKHRIDAPLFLLDLAVPRDIEPNVKELDNVHLYNIDDLQGMIDKGLDERRRAALKAEQLIELALDNYACLHRSRQVKNLICKYRNQMQHLADTETERALKQLTSGQCQASVLAEFSQRLLNKLTHSPTVGLRRLAWDNQEDLLNLAEYLFKTTKQIPSHEEIT